MKIGVAHFEYRKDHGIEKVSAKVADHLAAWGNDVHFHCIKHRHEGQTRVHFHKVWGFPIVNTFKITTFAAAARRQLRRGGYHITHSHGGVYGSDVIMAHSCHREAMKELGWSEGLGTADAVRLWIEERNYRRGMYRKVIAVSQMTKRALMKEYEVPASDIIVISPGTDTVDASHVLRHRAITRDQFGAGEEDFVLLFVGHEFRRKGLDVILRALGGLDHAHVRLWVAGGDAPGKYMKLAGKYGILDRIRFLGAVADLSPIYGAADALVFPTSYEPFGLVVPEAMAHGLPVIVSKAAGVSEDVVKKGSCGILLDNPSSHEELDSAIRMLAGNQALRQRMGAAGREEARQLSWDACARETLEVFAEVARQKVPT